jgi:hypothetical protein
MQADRRGVGSPDLGRHAAMRPGAQSQSGRELLRLRSLPTNASSTRSHVNRAVICACCSQLPSAPRSAIFVLP